MGATNRWFFRCAAVTGAVVVMVHAEVLAGDMDSPRSYAIGVGARATAMGGNAVGLSQDFAALQYNPAGLAFVRSREAHASLNGLVLSSTSESPSDTKTASIERLRFGSGGLVWAVPTSRGGLAFAIGYQCPAVFDDLVEYEYSSGTQKDVFSLSTQGHLSYYTLGMGLQMAPGLSAGIAASLASGRLDVRAERTYTDRGAVVLPADSNDYEHTLARSYLGYDLRMGLQYQFNDIFALGMRFVFPRTIRFSGAYEDYYPSLTNDNERTYDDPGKLRYMYEGAVGGAVKLPFLVLTPEIGFRGASMSADEESDAAHWKVGGGMGAEVPVGKSGLLVRLGYRFDEYDDQPALTYYSDDDVATTIGELPEVLMEQQTMSGGLAFVSKGALCIELAYAYRMWELRRDAIDHGYGSHQVLASLALRY